MTLRLLVVDDQALVRAGFHKLLEGVDGFEVVAEAADGAEAVNLARLWHPDVILMDVRMPVLDGIEATRRILAEPGSSARVLVLTTFGLDDVVFEALRAGASGFMLKDAPPEELIAAVRVVAAGEALLAPAVTRSVVEEFTRLSPHPVEPPGGLDRLTPREREVLELIARGRSNGEIRAELVLSDATVKTHVTHILAKLGLRDRVQAVIYAYEAGLVTPSARR
jgi:DNA-binding NarL/FixJ family response regulator